MISSTLLYFCNFSFSSKRCILVVVFVVYIFSIFSNALHPYSVSLINKSFTMPEANLIVISTVTSVLKSV